MRKICCDEVPILSPCGLKGGLISFLGTQVDARGFCQLVGSLIVDVTTQW